MRLDEKKTREKEHLVYVHAPTPGWIANFRRKYGVEITVYCPSISSSYYDFEVRNAASKEILFEIGFHPLTFDFVSRDSANFFETAMEEWVEKNYTEIGECFDLAGRKPLDKEIAKIKVNDSYGNPSRWCEGKYIFSEEKNEWLSIGYDTLSWDKDEVGEWLSFEKKGEQAR